MYGINIFTNDNALLFYRTSTSQPNSKETMVGRRGIFERLEYCVCSNTQSIFVMLNNLLIGGGGVSV